MKKLLMALFLLYLPVLARPQTGSPDHTQSVDPAYVFKHPHETAKPGVLWMWMGCNISKSGITKDLEALKKAGFGRTTMFSLADVTIPWAGEIQNSPTPEIISWTEPWWKFVRFAAEESKRLGMDFGMFNGSGYEASGGPWITPELSMQEIIWSRDTVVGNRKINITLKRPQVDPHANQFYPVFNPETGLVENPVIEARKTYYKDIAVMALPSSGIVAKSDVIDLKGHVDPDGQLQWNAPKGNWIIYRFGHTTRGTLIQPAQWKATGLECDKMSQKAVEFHINHIIGEIQKHLGDLIGTGFTHVHFDSYEAGDPTWTPKMREEFLKRRGYDLVPFLPFFAGRIIGSKEDSVKFRKDFDATVKDLYRDVYFATLSRQLRQAHLTFLCEPYGGPWRQDEIMPLVHNVMTEFWTNGGQYAPYELDPTVAALRKAGKNIVEAEAFTGQPKDSKWDETPEWLKPIGDAAFCAGVNRLVLHRFVQQPWDDAFKPGATMGCWGTHFDRTQTWWEPAKAMVEYWRRCQALLQWGRIAPSNVNDFNLTTSDSITVKAIHRQRGNTHVYFVVNISRRGGIATCSFKIEDMQPELWDPVTTRMRVLQQFQNKNGSTSVTIPFDKAQSFFVVFRDKTKRKAHKKGIDFPAYTEFMRLSGAWQVAFDNVWGGPSRPVLFDTLQDWTTNSDKCIRYYSGTATYSQTFDVGTTLLDQLKGKPIYLNLGVVKHIARIKINGKDLGVVWTAPWRKAIPSGLLRGNKNKIEIEVTNVWANRLIGDEQEPADCQWSPGYLFGGSYLEKFPDWFVKKQPRPSKNRHCFTTWNYFTKDSPLASSGLLGPVTLRTEE